MIMPWTPKCCNSFSIKNIKPALQHEIILYTNKQNTRSLPNQQITTFDPETLIQKKCHIVDRSTAAQETAINQNRKNAETAKEFICDYFDLSQYNFTILKWITIPNNITFEVIGLNPYSSYVINGVRYNAVKGKYFVGIQAGLINL